jgi:FkbM family methyltransferase
MDFFGKAAAGRFLHASPREKLVKLERLTAPENRRTYLKDLRWERIASQQDYVLVQGRETFLLSTRDQVISRQVYKSGEFDFGKFAKALEILGISTVRLLVDVGANVGVTSIPAIRRGLAEYALAIEAEPFNFWLLEINARLNSVQDRMECLWAAAARTGNGELVLELSGANLGDHRIAVAASPRSTHVDTVAVPTIQLDEVHGPLGRGDVIWMDVQGYEVEVLRGATQALSSGAALVMEYWPYGLHERGDLESVGELLGSFDFFFDLGEVRPQRQPMRQLDKLAMRLGLEGHATDILCIRGH